MLKIVGSHACAKTEIEFGDYLPFKFWHQVQSSGPHVYWRTGNFDSTLLEVQIDGVTGLIIGASLLLPGEVSKDFPDLDLSSAVKLNGYPVVNIDDWSDERIKDEPNALRVFIDSGRLLMKFSDSIAATKTISADIANFGLDANDSLIWILVCNLPKNKLVELGNMLA